MSLNTNENRHARRRPEQVERSTQHEQYPAVPTTTESRKSTTSAHITNRSAENNRYGRPVRDPATMRRATNAGKKSSSEYQATRQTNGRDRLDKDIRRQNRAQSVSNANAPQRAQVQRPYRNRVEYGQRRTVEHTQSRSLQQSSVSPAHALLHTWKDKRAVRAAEAEEQWQKDVVRVRGGVDKLMLGIILLLVALGTVMVFSASYPYALTKGYDVLYYGKRQLVFVAIGLTVMFLASLVPYRWYCRRNIVIAAYAVGVVLLLIVLFFGDSEGEARRWIRISSSITIQPSEIMKFILIVTLAYYMQANRRNMDMVSDPKQKFCYHVLYPGLIIGIACGLVILEKHLSATLIIGCIGLLVILIGGCDWKMVTPCFVAAGLIVGIVFVILNPYALSRLTTFGDENADLLNEKFQTNQSLYAIGSGGLFGVGLGESRQKYSYIFAAHNDFIFAIWCEEFGFIGAVCLILLFLTFIWRGYVIASRAPDTFSMLTAFGITTQVGIQVMLNMCVVADIIPNTGVPLPFFSYGGSSLVVLLGEMGVLLSISRQFFMTKEQLREEQARRELGLD